MNVLVIAPHPDDEAIGCGGALLLHAGRGDRLTTVFLTSGELGLKHLPKEEAWRVREGEAERAAAVLGIERTHSLRLPDWFVGDHIEAGARELASVVIAEKPALIYLPHPDEWHPDHAAALPLVRLAIAYAGIEPPSMRAYEIWTPLVEFDHVENICDVFERKLDAVRCYGSQLSGFRYDRAVRGLNEYRGALAAKCDYAEVFRHVDAAEET